MSAPRTPVPESLRKRGITGVREVAPFEDFRIKDAGPRLASMFGAELRARLIARQTRKGKACP